jgi:hypothetical protein
VGSETCKWGERKERRPVRGYRTGLLLRTTKAASTEKASLLSDGCHRGIRRRHLRHVSCHHYYESYRHRKNEEQSSYAAPMSRVEARSFAEMNSRAERNCCVAQSSHGCRCKTVACRSGCRSYC